ncbi:MAG: protein translocase subunit SecF [Marmoricola sp.]
MGRFSKLGNDLYSGRKSINFVGRAKTWYTISGLIVIAAILGLSLRGLNYGIEFRGGAQLTVSLPSSQVNQNTVGTIERAVVNTGLKGAAAPIVNTSGNSAISVKIEEMSQDQLTKVATSIEKAAHVPASKISQQSFGASWGSDVAHKALTGLIVFLIAVVAFIWLYFRQWKMSAAAIAALAHDIVITVGVYALSGFEVTPATVTGLLTILGFSLYDTVVVFDKIRENTKNLSRSKHTYGELANLAVNQSLVRSINTSIVALLPVLSILIVSIISLGDGDLKDLSLALFVGMAAGTYSSIFIATPLLVELKSTEKAITDQERRAKARQRRNADRYADVPSFRDDIGVDRQTLVGTPDELADVDDDDQPSGSGQRFQAPSQPLGATGLGRVVPEAKAPVEDSGSAKRPQPKRQPRSKR